ncbi:GNAT family N-acetyltransferase [Clostridium tertium]|uniref:GNAT family N-acetyltransferase n=1 Tax=Clostridium tertium TaxID=1559 RepID=UPI00241D09AA|nr:GNAT family N-acetyltransferase [Clostridium tertium]
MLEKLTLNNMESFKGLYSKSMKHENYDKDFFKCYNNQNFLIKFLYRKFMRIIKLNNTDIGYIWYEAPMDNYIRVWALYIDSNYINLINKSTLSYFDNSTISYEAIDNVENSIILERLGFKKIKYTSLMEMNIEDYSNTDRIYEVYNEMVKKLHWSKNINSRTLFSTRKLVIGKDEELRCNIQNDIFGEWNRRPLTVEDIYNDMTQDYFLKDLCIFGMINNSYIGYGQIIFNREMFTIVNFGIVNDFRGIGLGKLLLHEIILYAKKSGIKNLAIRVDCTNINAINLYKWIGFKEKYKINTTFCSRWSK